MATELVLLGTAGARAGARPRGISSALIVDGRVFVSTAAAGLCPPSPQRGWPSPGWTRYSSPTRTPTTSAIFLACCCTRGASGRTITARWPRVRVYGPSRPSALPAGDAVFIARRQSPPGSPHRARRTWSATSWPATPIT
jgi:hypothetical protein